MKHVFITVCLAVSSVAGYAASTYFVAGDGCDSRTGWGDWTNAAATISNAVHYASDGDTVLVSNGIYYLTAAIELTRTIVLKSINGPSNTVIDGSNSTMCIYYLNNTSSQTTVDGFTIQNGAANNGAGVFLGRCGGILRNCHVVANTAATSGGGVYSSASGFGGNEGAVLIDNCFIAGNNAQTVAGAAGGGGIWARYGEVHVRDTIICDNVTGRFGGGIYLYGFDNGMTVSNCVIHNNTSSYGGGIYSHAHSPGEAKLKNNLIHNNTSSYGGGIAIQAAVGEIEIFNCTIASNKATASGGGVYVPNDSTVRTHNSIIYLNVQNIATSNWSKHAAGELIIANSCTAPLAGLTEASHSLESDPLFVAPVAGDFRLDRTSACINTGTNQLWMIDASDLDGRTRIDRFSRQVDMGCYEYLPRGTLYNVH